MLAVELLYFLKQQLACPFTCAEVWVVKDFEKVRRASRACQCAWEKGWRQFHHALRPFCRVTLSQTTPCPPPNHLANHAPPTDRCAPMCAALFLAPIDMHNLAWSKVVRMLNVSDFK